MLYSIPEDVAPDRVADIVFVHGLSPVGVLNRNHAFTTWGGKDQTSDFWPRWLGEDLAKSGLSVGVWILQYDAAALGWLGHAMPLADRAVNVLDEFYGDGIGNRPIIFIAHSLGGLVVKQLLMHATTVGKATEHAVAEKTQAVIFLSTPHTGADLASFVTSLGFLLQQTDGLKDLVANAAPLRHQADWYINQAAKLGIQTRSYFETKKIHGMLVVDQTSANPHVAGASAVPVDEDHSTIARIGSRDMPQYKSMRRFIEDTLNPSQAGASRSNEAKHLTQYRMLFDRAAFTVPCIFEFTLTEVNTAVDNITAALSTGKLYSRDHNLLAELTPISEFKTEQYRNGLQQIRIFLADIKRATSELTHHLENVERQGSWQSINGPFYDMEALLVDLISRGIVHEIIVKAFALMDQVDTKRNSILETLNGLLKDADIDELPYITLSSEQLSISQHIELDGGKGSQRWDLFYLRSHRLLSSYLKNGSGPEGIVSE